MVHSKVLVLGGTGPAGICLLRELVHRKHETIVYARNPSKIDEDLASNELLEIIKGEMDDLDTLSAAMARSRIIISLLGPSLSRTPPSPTLFADIYKSDVFPLMREHGVRRIFAMGTPSISRPEDRWTLFTSITIPIIRVIANVAYQNILNIADAFEHHGDDLDWTVFRIAAIPGGHDEESWRRDREDGETFVGWVGESGWTMSQRRGALARWLVDAAEGGAEDWPIPSLLLLPSYSRRKMATGSRLSVVIPKMEQSPSMTTNTLSSIRAAAMNDSNSTSLPIAVPEDDAEPGIDPELLQSELELVSSLAKLQKLEEMIHQLRTLLPERLLEPLAPIVNPKAAVASNVPNSPQKLLEQLSQSARAGVDEVGEFKAMWRGKEMKSVWERIDTLIYENAGQLLQPNGMWDQDYGELLENITKHDTIRKEQLQKAKEEQERSQIQSAEGGWKALVDSFAQRNVPGVRVLPAKNDSSFSVVLIKAGLAFKIHTASTGQDGVPEFNVSSKSVSTEPTSKLENAVLDCLNSRPRKWDLSYLLEMISSYSTIFQSICIKCGKMQDKAANLPTLRRPKPSESQTVPQPPTFEAYHATCV
ncbi:mediator complex subunit 27-domain-containing protein [Aspergillus varians]